MTRADAPRARYLHSVGLYMLTGKILGRGNFARVEEAVHTLLNVKVAVKVIDTANIKEDYVRRNLEREAAVLARLSHPSIVTLFQTIKAGPLYLLVTELVPGGDLCTYTKKQIGGRLDERTARRLGRQLVSALAHMHSRGVIHRDLKMENVLLDAAKERIKIVDFGLSNLWDSKSLLQTQCGSPEYAAPELFVVGQKYGPEVDMWSLGVVLFGMVTGRLPFLTPREGTATLQDRRKHLLGQINVGLTHLQRRVLANMSPEFRNLVNRLLTPAVEKRLTLNELLFHPWVTVRQRRAPSGREKPCLDEDQHNGIMVRLESTFNMEESEVRRQLSVSPNGDLRGAYNILQHLKQDDISSRGNVEGGRSTITSSSQGQSTSGTRGGSAPVDRRPAASRSLSTNRPPGSYNPRTSASQPNAAPPRLKQSSLSLKNMSAASSHPNRPPPVNSTHKTHRFPSSPLKKDKSSSSKAQKEMRNLSEMYGTACESLYPAHVSTYSGPDDQFFVTNDLRVPPCLEGDIGRIPSPYSQCGSRGRGHPRGHLPSGRGYQVFEGVRTGRNACPLDDPRTALTPSCHSRHLGAPTRPVSSPDNRWTKAEGRCRVADKRQGGYCDRGGWLNSTNQHYSPQLVYHSQQRGSVGSRCKPQHYESLPRDKQCKDDNAPIRCTTSDAQNSQHNRIKTVDWLGPDLPTKPKMAPTTSNFRRPTTIIVTLPRRFLQ